ncbi:MAG: molybdenum cofactor biosynthesis protein B [Chromatocurvus sp.]
MGHTTMPSEPPAFAALRVAVLTVSDTRGPDSDTSGDYLSDAATASGHRVVARDLVVDDIYRIRARLSIWIADPDVEVVLVTGGTGFAGRDSTPEAVEPLFDKTIVGFGEVFRALSLEEIGTSTVQSRALAGLANRTLIFCMPGSTGACRTAWTGILQAQLDAGHRPCNFVGLLRPDSGS